MEGLRIYLSWSLCVVESTSNHIKKGDAEFIRMAAVSWAIRLFSNQKGQCCLQNAEGKITDLQNMTAADPIDLNKNTFLIDNPPLKKPHGKTRHPRAAGYTRRPYGRFRRSDSPSETRAHARPRPGFR